MKSMHTGTGLTLSILPFSSADNCFPLCSSLVIRSYRQRIKKIHLINYTLGKQTSPNVCHSARYILYLANFSKNYVFVNLNSSNIKSESTRAISVCFLWHHIHSFVGHAPCVKLYSDNKIFRLIWKFEHC